MTDSRERGTSLLIVMLVMMLMSALMIGFYASITADQRSAGIDRDQTQVYAVAHAGLEKLTSDLAALFTTNFAPTAAQISDLQTRPPVMSGFTYTAPGSSTAGSGYTITFTPDASGNPSPELPNGSPISSGPYQGFMGIITPYTITVTARSNPGTSEVRMKRTLQTVSVPVFQFGVFSENDLSFFAGPNFNFGGRVHTNSNLYLAEGDGATLTMADRVTAVGNIIRTNLSNGWATSSNYTGTVNAIKSVGVYRALASTEGSLTGDVGSSANSNWINLSIGTYNSNIRNGATGARRLDLPLVDPSQGAKPIDLIRRPLASEDTTRPLVLAQRYFAQASLRILLSDTSTQITTLPTIYTATAPINLESALSFGFATKKAPLAQSGGNALDSNYKSNANVPLIGGYIKIEKQNSSGVWSDVTQEILDLGITGANLSNGTADTLFTGSNGQNSTANNCLGKDPQPDAVLRLQRVKDRPSTHSGTNAITYQYDCAVSAATATTGGSNQGIPFSTASDYIPMSLYDPREGQTRDNNSGAINYGGVMYYIELDVKNLARWFNGTIGTTGNQAKKNNGYIVYFSDRRNNASTLQADCPTGLTQPCETGEYGFEDVVNPSDQSNGAPNGTNGGTPDAGEDLQSSGELGYGTLQTYGGVARNVPAGAASPLVSTITPMTSSGMSSQIARLNRPLLFRRALKLTNGGSTNLRSSGITGLTIASENPVYVQGDYNVGDPANFNSETHIAAAVLADAITLLSNSWNDIRSFTSPTDPSGRSATTTSFRMAVVAGKGVSFTKPSWVVTANRDFGTDGGAHNFLRYIENWGSATLNYRGSIVSFYTSRQATGTYKCCVTVYSAPTRGYNFDTEFLIPSKLPPGTPMFRDINTLTFRQMLRPNQ